ncbi:histidine--tRNA ligase [Butyrivibrio sp. CB08]|uniref:histidine--tRNA ligase n=1 Tax=Butyrivibrio sp. CB08 TaxID=2364879 RepID=UPI000EA938F4|nr:histidine--tRNA ligase [Butyrivibrio sp. CB08]RKM61281.1 histidine--tRNA ligase [Butyrivibrio sp. CB08]
MSLVKKPVTGMKDILPAEMQLRDYAIGIIKKTYGEFGFTSIETPAVESLANLNSKQGGENEKLIFKVMKRGEKLNLETAQTENDLTDSGLRYDLTVPLVRFYAAHAGELPSPFKALQMGSVWRADRPQKGRYRQFMQCDIDILGEASNLAEIELILATTTTLGRLGFKDFKIRINDRQILKAMAAYSGFAEDRYDEVFITLDKMDKIGIDGVSEELEKEGFDKACIDKYLDLFRAAEGKEGLEGLKVIADMLGDFLSAEVREGLSEIISSVESTKTAQFEMVFDPTLVRGMSYYTGTIFEVAMPQYGGSCGGGGRYDKMVGKFLGQDTPACGFSIGFERIIMIMMDEGFKIPGESEKTAFLIEKGIGGERLSEIILEAQKERASGKQVLVVRMNKNKKFQKQQLVDQGYENFKEFYLNPLS